MVLVKAFTAHHKYGFAIFFQLVHQRDEVAVAADNGERVHVGWVKAISSASSARLISPPFLSPRGEGIRCTICTAFSAIGPGRAFLAAPIGIREFRYHVASLL